MKQQDEEIMSLLQQGDANAADLLVERYQDSLFSFLYRLTINASDTEDLFQETWLRVIRYRNTYNAEKKFSTWLFQIALNCARDFFSHRKITTISMEQDVSAEDQQDSFENQEIAENLVRQLSLPQREVVVLKFFHQMKEVEISELLDIPLGTVKSRLHKAIQYLKSHYGDKEYAGTMDG